MGTKKLCLIQNSPSGKTAGANKVHPYRATQSHEGTIFTHTDVSLLFRCVRSWSGLNQLYLKANPNMKWKKEHEYSTSLASLSQNPKTH
ncbi:unnamed protein product [Nippostrongylus brasiliensis]|uniref:Ovule protein n=1 Tax=Nippostrongylus brasiliensis TaxID=27835 RepID=A0A0N4XKR2_NIPBR|nr:unnamed protein product [Nippostrongylus brasiliensis]